MAEAYERFRPPASAVQFRFGGEFGGGHKIDELIQRSIDTISNIGNFSPLFIIPLFDGRETADTYAITVKSRQKTKGVIVLSGLDDLEDYMGDKHGWGLVFVVPQLRRESIPPEILAVLKKMFEKKKVANPDNNHVWFVESEIIQFPKVEPKDPEEKAVLEARKDFIRDMGLVDVGYRHPKGVNFAWFEARPGKKPKTVEKDYSGNERIEFLIKWMKMVIEYRGGKIISLSKLQGKLQHSNSYLSAMQAVSEAKGVYSEETCGCLVHTSLNGEATTVKKCEGENCYENRKPRDSKPRFRLGKEYPISRCADCDSPRKAKAYWADMSSFDARKGINVTHEITCSGFADHSTRDTIRVDPARIVNPLYIYNCLHKKEESKKKQAA